MRIRIECAFGMLVQRWGILRMAMPKRLSIPRIIALVNALAKLHNFCIDENDGTKVPEQLNGDHLHMMNDCHGFVPMEQSADNPGVLVPAALMNGGHHFLDVPRNIRRKQMQQGNSNELLPRQRLLQQVIDSHMTRPKIFPN